MKAVFDRKSLLEAFSTAEAVAPSRSPKPIIQNVLMAIGDDGATLSGTDLETGVRCRVAVESFDDPGKIVLPASRFGQILRSGGDKQVAIEADGDKLVVKCGRSKFNLNSEDPDKFPDVPGFESEDYVSLVAADLRAMIRRTSYACDVASTRYALGGTLVELTNGVLSMTCTDGRRLAQATAFADSVGNPEFNKNSVVPLKALKLIDRSLDDDGDQVHFAIVNGQSAAVRTSNATIFSRLVEGRYPDYRAVIPASWSSRTSVNVGDFRTAIEQASIVTSQESRGVDFHFSAEGLRLTSRTADVGESVVEAPLASEYAGEPVKLACNGSYLIESLRSLEPNANLDIEMDGNKNPIVLKDGSRFVYVVMPIAAEN